MAVLFAGEIAARRAGPLLSRALADGNAGKAHSLEIAVGADVSTLEGRKAVRRDPHKTRAFVRSERIENMLAPSERKRERSEEFGRAPVPDTDSLERLREAAAKCRACPLWRNATCTVFGAGKARARVVLVGEQPGDQEDRSGEPFVGPAGQLLSRALEAAGVDRRTLYLTNAVKHFKWEPRGKRRLHQKPNAREVAACRPWLEAELRVIKPDLIVCLGSTAARSVVGHPVRVLSERGRKRETEFGMPALITVHPSSLLRLPEGVDAEVAFKAFAADLRKIRG